MARRSDLDFLGTAVPERERDYVSFAGSFPYRPTLFVGLGGTGGQAVSKVKRLFLTYVTRQVRARQRADVPDIDKLYSFLSFDTNRGERPEELIENREWFHLGVKDLRKFYTGIGQTARFNSWVVPDYPATAIMAGASGFRNLGRLALISNVHTVSRALGQAKEQIAAAAAGVRTVNPQPIVYLFCSISGGTGSGMFLDLSFLIRETFGGSPITGLLAVLGGLPSMPQAKRQETRVNAFAALKELNAFMSRTSQGLDFGGRLEYTAGAVGLVTEPFDECYLVSPGRDDSAASLPTQGHVSSFLARWAFMMSAYSFPEGKDTPDYAGIMVNHANRLVADAAGARTCYLVPGLAQVHFPVQTVADLFAIEATRAYIRYQQGGSASDGDQEARHFVEKVRLGIQPLREEVSKSPQSRGSRLEPERYDDEMANLFKSPRRHRAQVLAVGRKMGSARLKEIEATLRPNVDRIFAEHWRAIEGEAAVQLVTEARRGQGTLDFLRDLEGVLQTQRSQLVAEGEKGVDRAFDELGRQWSTIESVVDDVLTGSGVVDIFLDKFKRGRALALLVTYLNGAEETVLAKARNELTRTVLSRLIEAAENLYSKLDRLLRHDLARADKLLEERERELNTRLFGQAEASDASVENIGSVNVMTQAWRESYAKHSGLNAPQLLSALQKADWHPRRLLEIAVPEGKEVGAGLAHDLVSRIAPFFGELRGWSPLEVLRHTAEATTERPSDLVARVCNKNLQPQMELSGMGSRLGAPAFDLVFTGGIDAELKAELEQDGKFDPGVLQAADNQEADRITFAKVTMPIALAGCDPIVDVFEPEYDRWLKSLAGHKSREQEYHRRLYHCFPGSHSWPSPTRFSHERDALKTLFAKALGVSEMLTVTADDLERMRLVAKNPKEPRYALFQHGESQWWLWPFFEPGANSQIQGGVVKLGSNVAAALKALANEKALQEAAGAWGNWFEENWSQFFNAGQVQALKNKVTKGLLARKGRAQDLAQRELWDEILAAVEEWSIG